MRWGPNHGQGIASFIAQTSGDRLKIEHGSLYPALQRLLQEGWIDAQWGVSASGRRARFYRLTAAGRKQLTREQSRWRQFAAAVASILGPMPSEK